MKIKTQFIITMLSFGIILAIIAGSAVITNQEREKAGEQERIASSIAQGASELSYLSNNYLIYRESQQLKRWQTRFASFSSQVATLNVVRPEQQTLARNIQANRQRLKEVFDSVVSAVGNPSPNQEVTLDSAFLQVSWSRMAVQSQGLVSDASRLSQLLRHQADQLTEARTILMYAMLGLFGAFLLASYMLTYRRILKSIVTLQAGAAVIGSGNLDFVIEEKKNDEIGDLSRAFNQMTTQLKTVTSSKADLEREITERKRAEEELRESEERYKSLAENMPSVLMRFDRDFRVIYLSPRAEIVTGIPASEFIGKTNREMGMPKHLCDVWENAMSHVLQTGESREVTFDIKTPAGMRGFLLKFAPEYVAGEREIQYILGISTDITERKRAEEQLREAEEKSRLLIKYAPSMLYEIDFHHPAFKSVNDAMCQFLGYTREELLAMSPYDLLDDEGKVVFRERIRRQLGGEAVPDSVEYKSRTKDGREVYGILNMTFTYKDGKPEGAVVVAHDITERKRMEETLRQRTFELQHLTETLEQRVKERTEELANLASQIVSAQENERRRVSYDLHDNAWQTLLAIRFDIERLFSDREDWAALQNKSKKVTAAILDTVGKIRSMQGDLWPYVLDDIGILATIDWYCREFEKGHPGLTIERQDDLTENEIPSSAKIVIYRILQEALSNVEKHSQANRATIHLKKRDHEIEFTVEDNGIGFGPEEMFAKRTPWGGLGLLNIKARTEISGGIFGVESIKGKGTTLHASWPI